MDSMPVVGSQVKWTRHGTATVIGPSQPPSRFYTRLLMQATALETNAPLEEIELVVEKKKRDPIAQFKTDSAFYRIAGQLLRGRVAVEIHTPPKRLEYVINLLDSNDISYDTGLFVVKNNHGAWHGETFNIKAKNTGWELTLSNLCSVTKMESTHHNWSRATCKRFVFNYLVVELGFSLGSKHDLAKIRERVPKIFADAFEEGLRG